MWNRFDQASPQDERRRVEAGALFPEYTFEERSRKEACELSWFFQQDGGQELLEGLVGSEIGRRGFTGGHLFKAIKAADLVHSSIALPDGSVAVTCHEKGPEEGSRRHFDLVLNRKPFSSSSKGTEGSNWRCTVFGPRDCYDDLDGQV